MIAAKKEPVTLDDVVTPETIPLAKIHASEINPRQTFDDLSDLDSMATVGLIHPLRVRPSAKKHGDFEIVCGERRYRKAKALKWTEIRCEVQSLTDHQAREIAIIENLSRKDVPPLEEAQAFETLMKELAVPAEEIGKRIGKSKLYVLERVKLLGLCIEARTALARDDLRLGAAFWLCRLVSHDEQRAVLPAIARGMKGPNAYDRPLDEPASIGHAKELVLRRLRNLGDAPFDIADAQLVAVAGACGTCPKRTGAAPDLFGAVKKGDDSCTDAACWQSKVNAHNAKKLEAVKAKGLPILEAKAGKPSIWRKSYNGEYELVKGADVVDVDATEYHQDIYRNVKWADVFKGREVEIKTAIDDGGKEHQVVSRRKALEVLKEYSKEKKKAESERSPAGKAAKAKAKMPSIADRIRDAKKTAVLEALYEAAKKKPWAFLHELCLSKTGDGPYGHLAGDVVAKRRGLKNADDVEVLIEKTKDTATLVGILAELTFAATPGYVDPDAIGVDIEAVEELAAEEATKKFNAEKDAAKASTTKAPAKKAKKR